MQRQIKLGLVEFREDHTKPPFRKAHIKPVSAELEADDSEDDDSEGLATQVRGSCIYKQSQVAVKYLRGLLDGKLFDNPKDHVELKRLIKYVADDGVVLDFFAGSGSTGEAVFELLSEESCELQFILVQLPEPNLESDKTGNQALKAGYETIADITKERLRRAGAKIREELSGQLDFEQRSIDLGFKVLKLDQSNFKQWQAPSREISDEEALRQMELHINPINPDATVDDLLTEIMIKAGLSFTSKVETLSLAGHKVYSLDDGCFLIYLGQDIDQALIDAVLCKEPTDFVCLDSAFHGNEALRSNAAKSFETYNRDNDGIRVAFRTV